MIANAARLLRFSGIARLARLRRCRRRITLHFGQIANGSNALFHGHWFAVRAALRHLVKGDHPEITGLRVIDLRDSTSFRYGQTNSPFEYEKVRYVYREARKLQIAE